MAGCLSVADSVEFVLLDVQEAGHGKYRVELVKDRLGSVVTTMSRA